MKTLFNGEAMVKALLATRFAHKIGYSIIYAKRSGKGAVACYAIHKGKQYAFSTQLDISIDSESIPLDNYVAFAVAQSLSLHRVCFIFEEREKRSKRILKLINSAEFDSTILYMDMSILTDETKVFHTLNSLIMYAEDGDCITSISEMDVNFKATHYDYRAEIYKLLSLQVNGQPELFADSKKYLNKKELHEYLMDNISILNIIPKVDHFASKSEYLEDELTDFIDPDEVVGFSPNEREIPYDATLMKVPTEDELFPNIGLSTTKSNEDNVLKANGFVVEGSEDL